MRGSGRRNNMATGIAGPGKGHKAVNRSSGDLRFARPFSPGGVTAFPHPARPTPNCYAVFKPAPAGCPTVAAS